MKWFDEWFYQKWQRAWENKHFIAKSNEGMLSSGYHSTQLVEDDPHSLNDGLRVSIKKVIGGSLVTFSHRDQKNDRYEQKTYIITSEQDFNTELGKIITMESLR
jgi:hypothetical protein